jgi:hypothetical protein
MPIVVKQTVEFLGLYRLSIEPFNRFGMRKIGYYTLDNWENVLVCTFRKEEDYGVR